MEEEAKPVRWGRRWIPLALPVEDPLQHDLAGERLRLAFIGSEQELFVSFCLQVFNLVVTHFLSPPPPSSDKECGLSPHVRALVLLLCLLLSCRHFHSNLEEGPILVNVIACRLVRGCIIRQSEPAVALGEERQRIERNLEAAKIKAP